MLCLTPKALCFTSKARPFEVLKQESFNFQVVFKASSLLELVVGHVLKPRVPTFSSFLILSSSFLFCGEWNEGVVIYYLLHNVFFLSSRWSVPISHSSFAFLWFSRKICYDVGHKNVDKWMNIMKKWHTIICFHSSNTSMSTMKLKLLQTFTLFVLQCWSWIFLLFLHLCSLWYFDLFPWI